MSTLERKYILYIFCFLNLLLVSSIFAASTQIVIHRNSNSSGYEYSVPGEHVMYIYPLQGAKYVTPGSNIIIRVDNFIDPATINDNTLFNVTGSLSSKHTGKVILTADRKTILFKPDMPFTYGENVTVVLKEGLKTIANEDITIHPINFSISKDNLNLNKKNILNSEFNDLDFSLTQLETKTAAVSQTKSTSLSKQSPDKILVIKIDTANLPPDIPLLTINQSNNPSLSGYLFLSTIEGIATRNLGNYNMIIDNSGKPVYYNKVGMEEGIDFKIQPNGTLSYFDFNTDQYYILNTAFKIIDSVQCGNGYITDDHELRVYPDGNMFILGDNYETVDMSQIVPGGSKDATVEGSILQELDKNKNVIFQWRSWDHYQITDATHENLTALNIDYVHANAIEIDTDGNILLSARHLDEITKINSQTGDIIWRWGGKNNQFTFVNDSIAFSHQHAIRILPNDDKIFFDNGNFHTPPFSRAVEYNLDEVKKTAVLVWQFRNNPDIFGSALGYVQRLANGNTLISWGQADTTLSEVTPEGTVALQMTLPVSDWTYRVYRLPFIFIQSPSTNENLQSDAPTTIRWESSGVDSVNIDFSIDGGKTWNNIINNYPGDVDSLIWSVPNISSSNCKIRITESGVMDLGNVFISDSEFNISNLLDVKGNAVPYTYQLFNNYPNPFNPSTVISYSLAADSKVTIKIYNLLGQLIKELLNATQNTGNQQVVFNASNLSSGVYFYSMSAVSIDGKEEYSSIKKMVLLK